MTSPTIIQQPGAIDQAAAAFMQAFVIGNQLSRAKQQLQLEQQRVESETALQGAQAGEARSRGKLLDSQSKDLDAQLQGHALASAAATFLDDEHRIAQVMDGQDPTAVGYAREYIGQMRKSAADAGEATALTGLHTAQTNQIAQETEANARVASIAAQYTPQQLKNPNTLMELGRRVLAATGDPAKAHTAMQAFTPPDGSYTVAKLGDRAYMVDTKRGTWRDMGITIPPTQSPQAMIRSNAIKMAWARVYDAVQGLDQLARDHGIQATAVPTRAALAEGLAEIGAFGVKPFRKMGTTAAQAARSDPQQQAVSLYAQLIHNLATTQGGYRSMPLMTSMGSAYAAQSGQRDAELNFLNAERLQLLPFARAGMLGQEFDVTKIPGFDKWKDNLLDATQGATPEIEGDTTTVSEDDLNALQNAVPRQPND